MRTVLPAVMLALVVHTVAWSQSSDRPAAVSPVVAAGESRATAQAIRVAEAPVLDGRIDDTVWSEAPVLAGFTEREPVEGIPVAEDTEVRFIHTTDALYVGARMHGDPTQIRADVARRDAENDAEQLVLSFDTFLDRRTAYTFVVTAAGGRIDYLHPSDSENNRDYSFDPVWEARAVVDDAGWTAEVRIPFTQLRFNAGESQVWGVNVKRMRPALQQESLWQMVRRDETGWASRMGELRGIAGVRTGRRVEIQPYVASAGTFVSGIDTGDPFASRRELSTRAGADLKVGLGPNLTLDATFNPDFGQVEADPAVVNLSAFEVFFGERRPFFTEGSRLFNVGNLFYSRRIGARPQGDPDADYVDDRDNTTILGAAKLTGRLPSGLSVGLLGALTDRETVSTYDSGEDSFGRAVIEPFTGYGVARVEQQFGSNASTVGAILTGVRRGLRDAEDLAALLASTAVTGGLDGRFRWVGGEYDLNWRIAVSHIAGSEGAILRQQRISRRYFQRPDASHVSVDSSRTALSGYALSLGHSRTGAEHWLWDIDLWAESPGFEPNDLGSLGSTDGIGGFAGFTYRETTPGRFFRNFRIRLMTEQEWNYGGDWTASWYGLNLNGRFLNFWYGELGIDYNPQVFNHSLTRGGPLMRRSGFRGPFIFIGSPTGRRFQARLGAGGGDVPAGGWSYWIEPTLNYRPTSRLDLSVQPRYRRSRDPRQYVATRSGGPAATFGEGYIFARIDRSEIAARIRANYAVGPDLTLEAYLEPFASAGEYREFGELVAPRSHDLRLYGPNETLTLDEDGDYEVTDGISTFTFTDPAFNVRSFRSNLVLRWEWRPGSTLFLVWQQDRSGSGLLGTQVEPADLWQSVRSDGDNFLALKATYWLPW